MLIGNRGRRFRIRHLYFRKTPSCTLNHDDVISGLVKIAYISETVLDREKVTIEHE